MSFSDQSPVEPYWRVSTQLPTFPKLSEDVKADVAIVGGGISGITTAYLLAKEGLSVVLLEADKILNGTTGHTTAKITAQHDLIYYELIQHIGKEQAKLYYEANNDALQFVKKAVEENGISCDFSVEDAYLYSTTEEYASRIFQEHEAYKQLSIPGKTVNTLPLNIPITAGLVMTNQAQFHPLKYLKYLVEEFIKAGGSIYENTVALDVKEGPHPRVFTRHGPTVTCDYVVACSHFPFVDGTGLYLTRGLFATRLYANRSYVLGVKTKKEFPGGMFLSVDDPTRSLRYTPENGESLVLVGGENHKTGQGKNTQLHYDALQTFAEEALGIQEIRYKWSAQDLISIDKIPYIGPITARHPNILITTGYKKWGMSTGTAAGLLIKDIIINRANPYKELFSPVRFVADPSIKYFLKENGDVAKHLIKGKLEFPELTVEDLKAEEGSVIRFNGKRAGGYKDKDGKVHIVDTTCTHVGCELEWNAGDCTWDCPCHGSRFSIDGDVIEGPARKPLEKLE